MSNATLPPAPRKLAEPQARIMKHSPKSLRSKTDLTENLKFPQSPMPDRPLHGSGTTVLPPERTPMFELTYGEAYS